MKHLWTRICITLILGFTFSFSACAANSYTFDPTHTYIIWRVDHFGFSDVSGKFMAEGTLTLDETKPQNSKVNITIHTATVNTGVRKLDDILRGSNFFNVQQYQTATFVSTKVEKTGTDTGKVYGTLTIRGISRPVILTVKLNKMGVHPYYNVQAVGFTGSTTVKRSDFGLLGYLPGVSDETRIEIEAEAEMGSVSLG